MLNKSCHYLGAAYANRNVQFSRAKLTFFWIRWTSLDVLTSFCAIKASRSLLYNFTFCSRVLIMAEFNSKSENVEKTSPGGKWRSESAKTEKTRRSSARFLRRLYSEGSMLAIAPDSVPYYYGFITRENAELILWDRGCLDGMYLLRASHNRDAAYVLSVCQNKQVLHYRIIKDSNGMYHLHGIPLDKHVGPIEVLEQMQGAPCKLAIPCLKPLNVFMPGVNCGMTDDKLKEALQKKATEWGIQESELGLMLEDKENDVWKLILKTLHESESWFHGKISREEAEKRLAKGERKDGKFLVRERDDRSFTLSLFHNEHVKHYKIDVLPSSEVGIQDGPRFENLISLVSHYSVFSDGLWCCLQYPCVNLTLDLQPSGSSANVGATSPASATNPSPTVSWPLERRTSNSDLIDDANANAAIPDLISDCAPPAQPAFPLNRPIFSPIAENRNGSIMLPSSYHHQQQNPGDTSILRFMMSKLGRPVKPHSNQNTIKMKPPPPPKGPTGSVGSYKFKSPASDGCDGSVPKPTSVFYAPNAASHDVGEGEATPAPIPEVPPKVLAPTVPTKSKPHRTPPMVPKKRPTPPSTPQLAGGISVTAGKLAPPLPSPLAANAEPSMPPKRLTPSPPPPVALPVANGSFRSASIRKLTPPPPPPLSASKLSVSARKLTPPPPPPLSFSSFSHSPSGLKMSPPPVPAKSTSVARSTIVEDEAEAEQLDCGGSAEPQSIDDAIPPCLGVSDDAVPTAESTASSPDSAMTPAVEENKSVNEATVELRPHTTPTNQVKPLPRPRRNLPAFQKLRSSEQFEVALDKAIPHVSPADRHSSPAAVLGTSQDEQQQQQQADRNSQFDFRPKQALPDLPPPAVSPSVSPTIPGPSPLDVISSPVAKVRKQSLSPTVGVDGIPPSAKCSSASPPATFGMTNLLAELRSHPKMNVAESPPLPESDAKSDLAASVADAYGDQIVASKDLPASDQELLPILRVKTKCESSVQSRLSRVSSCEPQYEEIDPDYDALKDNENDDEMSKSALAAESSDADGCDLEEPQQESLVNEFMEECKWDDTREEVAAGSSSSNRSFQRKPPWTKEESELHFNTLKRHRTGPMAINRQYLQFQEKLGLGNFGDVMKATFKSGNDEVPCAVKMLRKNNMCSGKESIMKEARLMTKFDHPHIVRLLGVSEGEPFYLVMELAPVGPLSSFLKRNPNFAIDDILVLLKQVCQGMQYLESKQFVHRDLAARNVLLVNEGFIKISDFGMSKALGLHTDYYTVEPQGKLPLKWYAPECIYFFKFSTKSDVWSYGITLWEAMSYGVTPYQGMTGREILKMFGTNSRLGCPSRCPPEIYSIMMMCWQFLPEDRPTFSELLSTIIKQVDR